MLGADQPRGGARRRRPPKAARLCRCSTSTSELDRGVEAVLAGENGPRVPPGRLDPSPSSSTADRGRREGRRVEPFRIRHRRGNAEQRRPSCSQRDASSDRRRGDSPQWSSRRRRPQLAAASRARSARSIIVDEAPSGAERVVAQSAGERRSDLTFAPAARQRTAASGTARPSRVAPWQRRRGRRRSGRRDRPLEVVEPRARGSRRGGPRRSAIEPVSRPVTRTIALPLSRVAPLSETVARVAAHAAAAPAPSTGARTRRTPRAPRPSPPTLRRGQASGARKTGPLTPSDEVSSPSPVRGEAESFTLLAVVGCTERC